MTCPITIDFLKFFCTDTMSINMLSVLCSPTTPKPCPSSSLRACGLGKVSSTGAAQHCVSDTQFSAEQIALGLAWTPPKLEMDRLSAIKQAQACDVHAHLVA